MFAHHQGSSFCIKHLFSALLFAFSLPWQAIAATSNVDVYGQVTFSVGSSGTEYVDTLIETGANVAQAGLGLPNLALWGAHHRTLLDSGLIRSADSNCFWTTVDAAGHNQSNFNMGLAEVGVCRDIGSVRLGVGVGHALSRQDRVLGGKTSYDGQYLVAEAVNDFGNGLEASLSGFYGSFDTELRRNYFNGANIESSTGMPDAESLALRLRLDSRGLAKIGNFSLSPFAAYTWTETKLDAFSETGGGLPVQFSSTKWQVSDIRIGAAGKTSFSEKTDLIVSVEVAHAFESNTGGVTGPGFSLLGHIPDETWTRISVDVDHRLSNSTSLTFGLGASGSDESNSWGWRATGGLRANF
jgi:hypothetical protein